MPHSPLLPGHHTMKAPEGNRSNESLKTLLPEMTRAAVVAASLQRVLSARVPFLWSFTGTVLSRVEKSDEVFILAEIINAEDDCSTFLQDKLTAIHPLWREETPPPPPISVAFYLRRTVQVEISSPLCVPTQ